jgi:exopolysaccharide biosynthesis polyprenyl glycosylphosphotransferase
MFLPKLFLKRIVDIFIGSILLLLMAPVFLITAISLKIFDQGPVFYKQTRVGKNGKEFLMYKFRSMVPNADLLKNGIPNGVEGPVFKVQNDPRITKIGKIIRRRSIDEIPQFYNVLKGDMSLVGPRPLSSEEMEGYDGWRKIRLTVLPGITGWWQIKARENKKFDEWIQYDQEYIQNWSLWNDMKILYKTGFVVLKGKGAF